MNWLDLILILVIAGYIWGGWQGGLIQAVGGVVGLLLGSILASRLYIPFSSSLLPVFNGNEIVAKVVAFLVLFFVFIRIIAVIFWILNKFFHFFAMAPGLKFANKVGGAAVGFLEGALFLGLVLQFSVRLPLMVQTAEAIQKSRLASLFLAVSGWLVPFWPTALKESQKVIDQFILK